MASVAVARTQAPRDDVLPQGAQDTFAHRAEGFDLRSLRSQGAHEAIFADAGGLLRGVNNSDIGPNG